MRKRVNVLVVVAILGGAAILTLPDYIVERRRADQMEKELAELEAGSEGAVENAIQEMKLRYAQRDEQAAFLRAHPEMQEVVQAQAYGSLTHGRAVDMEKIETVFSPEQTTFVILYEDGSLEKKRIATNGLSAINLIGH